MTSEVGSIGSGFVRSVGQHLDQVIVGIVRIGDIGSNRTIDLRYIATIVVAVIRQAPLRICRCDQIAIGAIAKALHLLRCTGIGGRRGDLRQALVCIVGQPGRLSVRSFYVGVSATIGERRYARITNGCILRQRFDPAIAIVCYFGPGRIVLRDAAQPSISVVAIGNGVDVCIGYLVIFGGQVDIDAGKTIAGVIRVIDAGLRKQGTGPGVTELGLD